MANPPYALPIDVPGVKSHLVGLDNWLAIAGQSFAGNYTDTRILQRVIPAALARFERETQWLIQPCQVVANPDGTYDNGFGTQDITGTLPLRNESPYSYDPDEIYRGFFVQTLRHRPVTAVQRIRLMFGPNLLVLTLPPEWYRLDFKTGRVWQIPFSGSAITAIVAFSVLNATLIGGGRVLPTAVACDYTCGLRPNWWDPTNANYDPTLADLTRVLEEYAALYVLQDISQAVNAGMQSVSVGARGFGQNQAYDRFKERKEELQASVGAFQETLHEQETPILLDFI